MPSPGFFNENANRSYPFVAGTVDRQPDGPTTVGNLMDRLVVDAGFWAGPRSGFVTGASVVRLAEVRRAGSFFYLTFVSDAPGLYGVPVVFVRHVAADTYAAEFADSGTVGLSGSSESASRSRGDCEEPLWGGFLVTATMNAFELLLPGDGVVAGGDGQGVVEPALVQNLAGAFVHRIGLANDDRTRVDAAQGCDAPVFDYQTGVVHVNDRCVVGDVVVMPGYNATVRQTAADNAITLGAAVGAGEGQPCGTVRLFPGESPPPGSSLLEGGPRCNETIRSVNGVGGRQFQILSGPGVTVTPVPAENRVVVDVNLNGLALQLSDVSARSESC